MKEISLSAFKLMKVAEIKEGGSFKLTADGDTIAMVMVPISGDKRNQLESMASQMNSAIGVA